MPCFRSANSPAFRECQKHWLPLYPQQYLVSFYMSHKSPKGRSGIYSFTTSSLAKHIPLYSGGFLIKRVSIRENDDVSMAPHCARHLKQTIQFVYFCPGVYPISFLPLTSLIYLDLFNMVCFCYLQLKFALIALINPKPRTGPRIH